MQDRFALTPTEVTVLRALNERAHESSPIEVAVSGMLMPNEARSALASLANLGLANSWVPVTGKTGEQLYISTQEGTSVCKALEKFKGTLPVGTVFRVAPPTFSAFLSKQSPVLVEITPEVQEVTKG